MATVARPISLPVAPLTGVMDAVVAPTNNERLAKLISRLVMRRTGSRVQELCVEVIDDIVRLKGQCASFYVKQLAQHATMDLVCGATIVNDIQVDG
jgi:hypothetical protein